MIKLVHFDIFKFGFLLLNFEEFYYYEFTIRGIIHGKSESLEPYIKKKG